MFCEEESKQGANAVSDIANRTLGRSHFPVPSFEILFTSITLGSGARRLSSAWESTRLKIELSPVQIGEAAFFANSERAMRLSV